MTLTEALLQAVERERRTQEGLVAQYGKGSTLHVLHSALAASYRRVEDDLKKGTIECA